MRADLTMWMSSETRSSIAKRVVALVAGIAASTTTVVAAEGAIPRMPSGEPDLTGTYTINTLTPIGRHPKYGNNPFMDEADARKIEGAMAARLAAEGTPGDPNRSAPPVGGYGGGRVTGGNGFALLDMGAIAFQVDGKYRNSVLTDPPNGRMPAVSEEGKKRRPAFTTGDRMGPPNPEGAWWMGVDEVAGVRGRMIPTNDGRHRIFDHPEILGLWERCIYYDRGTVPALRRGYGAYYGITQTETHVVILAELLHWARVIRLDAKGRSVEHRPSELASFSGDAIGWFEGDTLVVDSTNFLRYANVPHHGLHIVERFTPQADGSLSWEFSVYDPDYEATWGGSSPWLRTDQRIYEYACHEGNYSMGMTMRGARLLEKEWYEQH